MSKNPQIYKEKIIIEENLRHAPIDSWDEVSLSHPIFNASYLYSLIPVFEELDFVQNAYIASNGLVRLNIKGKRSNMFNDIALHPGDESILLIRDYRDEFKIMEDIIIDLIKTLTENRIEGY